MRLPVAFGLAVALTACASVPPGPSLAGVQWRVSAISGDATPANASNYRMDFKDGWLSAQFGCNIIGGSYRINGETLTTSGTTMTEMACIGPADEFEGRGLNVIAKPMRIMWSRTGSATISNDAGSISLMKR